MKKILVILMLAVCYLGVYSQKVPLGMRLETQKTWVKFVPKTYLHGDSVGTLIVTVRNYTVRQIGRVEGDSLDFSAGQLYVDYVDARGTERRRYLGYYHGYDEWEPVAYTEDGDINPGFNEQTSNLRLANTIFYNKDTTKCHYFQLDRWSIPYKMDLLPWMADDKREVNLQK